MLTASQQHASHHLNFIPSHLISLQCLHTSSHSKCSSFIGCKLSKILFTLLLVFRIRRSKYLTSPNQVLKEGISTQSTCLIPKLHYLGRPCFLPSYPPDIIIDVQDTWLSTSSSDAKHLATPCKASLVEPHSQMCKTSNGGIALLGRVPAIVLNSSSYL